MGETSALRPTLTTTATLSTKFPSRSPNRESETSQSPIALDTTANEKIVLAKSYSDHATATRALPDAVSPPSRASKPIPRLRPGSWHR